MLPGNLHNEPDLLLQVAQGDATAFKQLFDAYWGRIYANALKFTKSPEEAKDLSQDIFIKVWSGRSKLSEVKQFDAYLFKIAKHVIFDFFDKRTLAVENEEYLSEYFKDNQANPADRLETKQLEETIEKAIARLPEQVQTAFRLSRKEGLNHAQIAERMNVSRITSKSYISRAILSIKSYLLVHAQEFTIAGAWVLLTRFYFLRLFFQITAFHCFVLPSLIG